MKKHAPRYRALLPVALLCGCAVEARPLERANAEVAEPVPIDDPVVPVDAADPLPIDDPVIPVDAADPCEPPERPIADPITEEERVLNLVLDMHLGTLHRLIGRYACGEAVLYRGVLCARDNQGVLLGREDRHMPGGPVFATLAWSEAASYRPDGQRPGHVLEVVSRAQHQRVRLVQVEGDPATTETTPIMLHNEVFVYNDGSCVDCVSQLAERPSLIAIQVSASGRYGEGSPMELDARGSLDLVPPSEIEFADLVSAQDGVGHGLDEFSARDGEMVRTAAGSISEELPPAEGTDYDSCSRAVNYTVEEYVDASNLLDYGARDLSIVESRVCCWWMDRSAADCFDEGGSR